MQWSKRICKHAKGPTEHVGACQRQDVIDRDQPCIAEGAPATDFVLVNERDAASVALQCACAGKADNPAAYDGRYPRISCACSRA